MSKNTIVGEKVKAIRESKEISREELAERSTLTVAQVVSIEEDEELPSLAPLIKIARTLGVRLGTFLDDLDENGAVICRKDQSSKKGIDFTNGAMNGQTHMEYHSLSSSKQNRHMESFIIEVSNKNDDKFDSSSHEGEEFIYVLEGNIEVDYGKEKYQLSQGDSIYYDSIIPHHIHVHANTTAKILAVVYTPI